MNFQRDARSSSELLDLGSPGMVQPPEGLGWSISDGGGKRRALFHLDPPPHRGSHQRLADDGEGEMRMCQKGLFEKSLESVQHFQVKARRTTKGMNFLQSSDI